MTELDLEIPGEAKALIDEYGKDIIYTLVTPGSYNRATNRVENEELSRTLKGVVEPFKAGASFGAGLVEIGDLKVTCSGPDFVGVKEPSPNDLISFDSKKFVVQAVLPTYSGELVACYEFQIRRG